MSIQVTCACGQPFTTSDAGAFPRLLSCHICGRKLQLDAPDRVSIVPTDGIQEHPSAKPTQAGPEERDRRCPDCNGSLEPIKLFGRSTENPLSGAAIDCEVNRYTAGDAGRGWLWGMFAEKGRVHARICTMCRRIFLYG